MSDNFFANHLWPVDDAHINLISGQTHGVTVAKAVGDINIAVAQGTLYGNAGAAFDDCRGGGSQVAI